MVVIDDHWHSAKGANWLGNNVGGYEVAMQDVVASKQQSPRNGSQIKREKFMR